jgi:FkbM family methyltransferase
MRMLWRLLRFVPPGVLTFVKHHTGSKLRFWLRQKLGADYRSIPDRIQSVPDGRKFHIGPDFIYWGIYMGVGFEPEATNILGNLVKAGQTVVDVGANFGWYTTLFSRCVGSTGRVHAFEPVPTTYERLQENLGLNQLQDFVSATRSAVGEAPGQAKMHIFKNLSSANASMSALDQKEYDVVEAPIIRLDDYLKDNGVRHVDFLKVDVEGAELMVLKGARGLLAAPDAPLIMVEINDETSKAFGFRKEEIWDLLVELGYGSFYEIAGKEKLRRVADRGQLETLDLLLCAKGKALEDRLAGSKITVT